MPPKASKSRQPDPESEEQVIKKLAKQVKLAYQIWEEEKSNLEAEIKKEVLDNDIIQVQLEVFQEAAQRLHADHGKLIHKYIESGDESAQLMEEQWASKIKKDTKLTEVKTKKVLNSGTGEAQTNQQSTSDKGRKLPKLELPKFSGKVREWLPYWSQFQEIDKDKSIPNADKFQYLLQSTVEGSEARELLLSYPITGANYQLAVDHLRKRYGNDKLLVKVYVRDLLRLVIDNAKNEKVSLSSLYVKLSAQLRALGTLGVTSDKCAAVIYPLVESCLPEEVLRAWQRDPSYKEVQEKSGEEELNMLILFLEREVGAEENIKLACGGLTTKSNSTKPKSRNANIPTASTLVAADSPSKNNTKGNCIFCEKHHASHECGLGDKMTLEDKKKCINEKKACFNCLKIGHSAKRCKNFIKCFICTKRHCTIMCPDLPVYQSTIKDRKTEDSQEENVSVANMANQINSPEVLLQTLVLEVKGSKQTVRTRAMIDTGSQRSYILSSIAETAGLQRLGAEKINHVLFGGLQTQTSLHNRYKVVLKNLSGSFYCDFDVSDIPIIAGHISTVPNGPWIDELNKKGVKLSDYNITSKEIGVLIGSDVAAKLMTGEKYELKSGPVAVNTLLGWTLMGKLPRSSKSNDIKCMQLTTMHMLDFEVPKLWELDTIGITDPTDKKCRQELEDAAMKHFNETVQVTDEGRYQVRLPFVEGHPPLPSNHVVAEKRLRSTTESMKREGTIEKYDKVLKDWEEAGMIEKVPDEERNNYGHYLPHRAVYKPNSTTPIRPVFDASSKTKGNPSLNDCMEKGPNLLEQIPTIITKFRMNPVGVIADIRKAFQQITVAKPDRDYLRFIWWNDMSCADFKIYRHCRVVFGVSSSPFLLGATLKHIGEHTPDELKSTAKILDKSMYVDNLVASVQSKEDMIKLQQECDQLLLPKKFELRGWEYGPSQENKDVPVLGLLWNLKDDCLRLDFGAIKKKLNLPITKRNILSLVHMVFDPIGFTSPVTLIPKMMIQETWALKLGWDVELPTDMQRRIKKWRDNLITLEGIKIPRWINPHNEDKTKWSLHMFCDASMGAYAAIVYARIESESGVRIQLLQAKTRVAPLKKVTIPRLELLSCGIGARLLDTVKNMLDMPDIPIHCWTDSSTALYWIRNTINWGVFVQRRVDEIRKLTQVEQWKHISGENNPADLPSRGCTAEVLLKSKWWEGSDWLTKSEDEWPTSDINYNEEEIKAEMKKSVVSAHVAEEDPILRSINQLKNYEDMVALASKGTADGKNELTADEFIAGEQELLRLVQKSTFKGINDERLKKLPSLKDDHGIIRLQTRLTYGEFEQNFKTPIILPDKSPVVEALIRYEHNRNSHASTQTLLSIMRERFWILKGRRTIKQAIRTCESCQRFTVKGSTAPVAALPKERLHADSPFQITGVDLFGPLILRGGTKAWVALFTCAVYRAVHLEVVSTLSSEEFIGALRRFVARRGRPDVIFSDNGTNFVGCNNLFRAINWNKVSRYGPFQRIDWRFNPPTAAWWGGWWERLVGVVKQSLRKVLGKASLNHKELVTVLCDVEGVVNQRPLTYIADDPKDLLPLTPQLFLVGDRSSSLPEADVVDGSNMNKRLKLLQQLREHLRNRFRKEYLGQLTNPLPKRENRIYKVGDVVLIGHDGQKRLDWPIGKITEVIPGKDGKVRVVRVKTDSGEFLRPIQRIYPMEVEENEPSAKGTSLNKLEEPDPVLKKPDDESRYGRKIKIPERLTFICI